MNHKCLLLIFVFFSLISACTEDIEPTDYPINEGITIKVWEYTRYDYTEDPQLYLNISSIDVYHCSSSPIITQHAFKGGILDIEIFGVNDPWACAFLGGPAIQTIDIDESVSTILLKHGNQRDRYRLNITEEVIEIIPVSTSFSSHLYDKYLRIPENSFKCDCSTTQDQPTLCDDFIDILMANLEVEEHQFPEGIPPYAPGTSTDDAFYLTKHFDYGSFEAFETAKALLSDFAATEIEPNSGIHISLEDWRGERVYSWQD